MANTSLAAQLKQLKAQPIYQEKIEQPSILYSNKISSAYDLDHVFYLANLGINQLIQLDTRFSKFQPRLFSVASKGVTRTLLNENENQVIDQEIKELLLYLSEYFSFDGTHLVIEYLLRNYRIHEYLPNELVICFIQYHSTSIYTRLVQNIIKNQKAKNNIWQFFYKPVSQGEIISREQLLKQIKYDYRILKLLLEYTIGYLQQQIKPQETQDIIVNVTEMTEEDIRKIKAKQSHPLSFLLMVLTQLGKLNEPYLNSIRSLVGKVVGYCIEWSQNDSLAFVYLLLNDQLVKQQNEWLNQQQVNSLATHIYNNQIEESNHYNLKFLLYQFGIQASTQFSVQIIDQFDLKQENPMLLYQVLVPMLKQQKTKLKPEQSKKLVQWSCITLQGQFKDLFIEQLLPELLNSPNTQLKETLIDSIKPYCADNKFYNKIFADIAVSKVTIHNVDQLVKQGITKLSAGQVMKMVDDIIKLTQKGVQDKGIQIIKLLAKLLTQNEFNQAQFLNLQQYYQLCNSLYNKVDNQMTDCFIKITKYILDQFPNNLIQIFCVFVTLMRKKMDSIQKFLAEYFDVTDNIYSYFVSNYEKELTEWINDQTSNTLSILLNAKFLLLKENIIKSEQFYGQIDDQQRDQEVVQEYFESKLSLYIQSNNTKFIQELLEVENPIALRVLKLHFLQPSELPKLISLYFENQGTDLSQVKLLLLIQQHTKQIADENSLNTFAINGVIFMRRMKEISRQIFQSILMSLKKKWKDENEDQEIQLHVNPFSNKLIKVEMKLAKKLINGAIKMQKVINTDEIRQKLCENMNFSCDKCFDYYSQIINNEEICLRMLQKHKQNALYLMFLKPYLELIDKTQEQASQLIRSLPQKDDFAELFNEFLQKNEIENEQCKTSIVIYIGHSNIENKYVFTDEQLNWRELVEQYGKFENISYFVDMIVMNIQYIEDDQINAVMNNDVKNIVNWCQIIRQYIEYAKGAQISNQILTVILKYLNKNQDLEDPLVHHNLCQLIQLLGMMMRQKNKKIAFKQLLKLVQSKIDESYILQLLRIVVNQIIKYNSQLFNQTSRFVYFMVLEILILNSKYTESNIQLTFSQYDQSNYWVIFYLASSYKLDDRLINDFKNVQVSPQIRLNWINKLSESVCLENSKILKKVEMAINSIGWDIKFYSKKRRDLNILNQMEWLIEESRAHLLQENKENGAVLNSFRHLQKIREKYQQTKISVYCNQIIEQLFQSLNVDAIFTILTHQEISDLLIEQLNNSLDQGILKLKKKHFQSVFTFIQVLISNDSVTLQQATTLNHFFTNNQLLKAYEGYELLDYLFDQLNSSNTQIKSYILHIFGLHVAHNHFQFISKTNDLLGTTISQIIAQQDETQMLPYEQHALKSILSTQAQGSLQEDQSQETKIILFESLNLFLQGFKGLISKQNLEMIIILWDSDNWAMLFQNTELRVLVSLIPNVIQLAMQVSYIHVKKVTQFIKQLIQFCQQDEIEVSFMNLTEDILVLLDYGRVKFIDNEIEKGILVCDEIENKVIEGYLSLVMKMNDIQLKRSFNRLLVWSKEKLANVGYNFDKFRRITLFKMVSRISNKMGQYFTKYYAYIFELMISELNAFHEIFQLSKNKGEKRSLQEDELYYELYLLQTKHILQSLEQLCAYDKDDFLDTSKFESLLVPISNVLDCPRVEDIVDFVEQWVISTIIALFECVNDDYKWKSLHNQVRILQVLQKHQQKKSKRSSDICQCIISLIDRLVDQVDDRYVVLINDLIPYLHQYMNSIAISAASEQKIRLLIVKLDKISGEDIKQFLNFNRK